MKKFGGWITACLVALVMTGCTTRIPYTGDLIALHSQMIAPHSQMIAPLGNIGPEKPAPNNLANAANAPIPGLELHIPDRRLVSQVIWVGMYSLWPKSLDDRQLVYAIKRDVSGAFLDQGRVSIRVDGTHALVCGGNDQVIGYIRFTIEHMSHPPIIPNRPVQP